ncbi:unnamed protein product, partial [Ectocarpus sp. 12 AP-2014]
RFSLGFFPHHIPGTHPPSLHPPRLPLSPWPAKRFTIHSSRETTKNTRWRTQLTQLPWRNPSQRGHPGSPRTLVSTTLDTQPDEFPNQPRLLQPFTASGQDKC